MHFPLKDLSWPTCPNSLGGCPIANSRGVPIARKIMCMAPPGVSSPQSLVTVHPWRGSGISMCLITIGSVSKIWCLPAWSKATTVYFVKCKIGFKSILWLRNVQLLTKVWGIITMATHWGVRKVALHKCWMKEEKTFVKTLKHGPHSWQWLEDRRALFHSILVHPQW